MIFDILRKLTSTDFPKLYCSFLMVTIITNKRYDMNIRNLFNFK